MIDEKISVDELFDHICEKGQKVLNMMIREKLQEFRHGDKKSILTKPLGVIF